MTSDVAGDARAEVVDVVGGLFGDADEPGGVGLGFGGEFATVEVAVAVGDGGLGAGSGHAVVVDGGEDGGAAAGAGGLDAAASMWSG